MKAKWNNQVIAESNDIVNLEGNAYFPVDSIHEQFFKPSTTHTVCPWKGTASYYNIEVNGETNKDAAWFYPQPSEKASLIKDRIAFWRGVEITES